MLYRIPPPPLLSLSLSLSLSLPSLHNLWLCCSVVHNGYIYLPSMYLVSQGGDCLLLKSFPYSSKTYSGLCVSFCVELVFFADVPDLAVLACSTPYQTPDTIHPFSNCCFYRAQVHILYVGGIWPMYAVGSPWLRRKMDSDCLLWLIVHVCGVHHSLTWYTVVWLWDTLCTCATLGLLRKERVDWVRSESGILMLWLIGPTTLGYCE